MLRLGEGEGDEGERRWGDLLVVLFVDFYNFFYILIIIIYKCIYIFSDAIVVVSVLSKFSFFILRVFFCCRGIHSVQHTHIKNIIFDFFFSIFFFPFPR